MNGEEPDAAIGVEDVLRAVAVMYVPVDDHYAIELMLVAGRGSRDRNVAEEAKTHRMFTHRVMARRPHEAERCFRFALEHAIDGVARRPGG